MADRIVIDFTANVREVTRGTDEIADSLKETERNLEDVGTEGERSLEKLTKGQEEADAAAKDLANTVKSDTAGSFDDLAQSAEDGLGGIGDQLLGIVGIAGGVGGAVATGLGAGVEFVTGLITDQIEAAATLKSDLIGAYTDAAAAGLSYLETTGIIRQAIDLQADPSKMQEFRKAAELIGVDVNTYLLAQAGSYKDLQVVIEAARLKEEERGQVTDDQSKAGQAAALKEAVALDAVIQKNELLIATHREGNEIIDRTAEIRDELGQRERDQIQRTRDADQARYEALGTAYDTAAGRPPIDIRTTLEVPDVDSIFAGLQARASSKILRFKAEVTDRNGKRVD